MPKKFFDIIPPKEISFSRNEKQEEKIRPVRKKKRFFLKSLVFCFVLLILVITSGLFLFSKVEVQIWPETEILILEENLVIDLNVEIPVFDEKVIPGRVFSNEKSASQEFLASGKILKEEKATGVIRVYNNYHLTQILVVNTRFQPPLESFQPSLDGEKGETPWFRTLNRIVIPSKSYKEVRVIADSPGEKYNIKPAKFSIPGLRGLSQYTLVYGESFEEFKGGFRDEVSQISQEDIDGAEIALTEELKEQSREFFKTTVPKDFVLSDETISQEIIEAGSSLEAGTEAESFMFQVKIKSEGVGFKRSDLENFANSRINLNMPEGAILQEESLEINHFLLEQKIDEEGKIVLSLEIKAKVYSDIDLDELKKALLGKSLKEARIFLENLPGVTKVELKSWPFLKSKIPEDMEEIEVRLMLD